MMSSWNFSYAKGDIPIYSSTPSFSQLVESPVYINTGSYEYHYGCNNSDVDFFYYHNTQNNTYKIIFAYSSSLSDVSIWRTRSNMSDVQAVSITQTYGTYKYSSPSNTSSESGIFGFPYLGEFQYDDTAMAYFVENGIQYEESSRYPFTFQNGYLFVYDLGNTGTMYSFELSSNSMEYSDVGSNPFPDTNQSYWFSNLLPEMDETTIPDSSATIIHWDKGSNTNIFGQSQDMIATISGNSSGRYLYIYNPPVHYKWSGSSNPTASEVVNYPVIINGVSSGDTFYIYDSSARLYDFNQGGKIQGTVVGETGYGSVATNGAISVTTTNGAIYNQTAGGSTDISGASGGSIAENIRGLQETLDNFVEQFVQLLSAPISHIQQLIQSGQNFFSFFTQLFDWLPAEVSGVIASALIVMIVIGVLKMLL